MEEQVTQVLPAFDAIDNAKEIAKGATLLRHGKLVVFPTETVYGIGANALDEEAVSAIFKAKGRPQDNPLIIHISSVDEIHPLVESVPVVAKKLADAFWPGPLTMIFPKSDLVSSIVSAGLPTVAIRIPSHPIASALIQQSGVPIAAPSANRSGSPSPTRAEHVYHDLKGRVPLILDGGSTEVGIESTVITFENETPKILRPGGITPEDIERIAGKVIIDSAVLSALEENRAVSSPGLKYKHYAPKAKVTLVLGSSEDFVQFSNQRNTPHTWAMAFAEDLPALQIPSISYGAVTDEKKQAQELFSTLRLLDEKGAQEIYVHASKTQGIGLAVYNRLLRAAAFRVIDLNKKD